MTILPIDKCIDVLDVFCAHQQEELWTNKIVKKVTETTGSKDVPKIKNAIIMLEKAKILKREKRGKQNSYKMPTQLGEDIIDLMITLESIHKKFNNLFNEVKNHIKLVPDDEETRLNKLKHLKWNNVDIEHYEDLINMFHFSIKLYVKNIYNLLIYRYLAFVKGEDSLDSNAKEILLKIITKEFEYQFKLFEKIESIEMTKLQPSEQDPEAFPFFKHVHTARHSLCDPFFSEMNKLMIVNYYPVNPEIRNKLDELYISMIQLSNEDKYIDKVVLTKYDKELQSNRLDIYTSLPTIKKFYDDNNDGNISDLKSFDKKYGELKTLYQKTLNTRRYTRINETRYPNLQNDKN